VLQASARPFGRPELEQRAEQEGPAREEDRYGRELPSFADRPSEPDEQTVTGAPAVPAAVEDEAEEDAERDQREADHVALVLVELRQPREPARQVEADAGERALTAPAPAPGPAAGRL
jgi:hypothetical protein